MSPRIQAIISKFVGELTAAIQEDAVAAFSAAIGGGAGAAPAARASRGRTARAPSSTPGRRKGAKRDASELEALTAKLAAHIKRNPGQRIEQIGKELGISTKELALPVKKLMAAKRLSTKGHRRATSYYAK